MSSYVDERVQEGTIPLSNEAERQALLMKTSQDQDALWRYAVQSAEADKSPTTSGLFIQSLNELIDSYGRHNAALDRHVPEVVLLLLYGTFLMTWGIVGYAAGIAGHRVSAAAYIMLVLVLLVVFIIIDLDRPRRGLIEVDQSSLTSLQSAIHAGDTH